MRRNNFLMLSFDFTEEEKISIQNSLEHLRKKIDFFSILYYHYFLQTDAGLLFNGDPEKQYKMFASSLNVIINHIFDPSQLNTYLEAMITKHMTYGIKFHHIDLFINSFMTAWKELYDFNYDQVLYNLWKRLISEVMNLFSNYLV